MAAVDRARALGAFVAVAVVAALPLAVALAAGRSIQWRDTAALFAPIRPMIVEALRAGRLPAWNPHEGLGIPLLAQMMHGVLHPVGVLAAWTMPAASLDLLAVVHVGLAAVGAAVLARTLGASSAGAFVAGIAFGLSGYVLSVTANFMYLVGAATAPWTVAALRAAARRGAGALAGAAAVVAAQWLAGDPQWAAVAVVTGLALAAEGAGWPGLARAAGAVALGTGVAAVQLAPTAAFLADAVRGQGLTAEDRLQWALSPWRLAELVAPGMFSGRPGAELVSPVFLALGGERQRFFIPFASSVHVGVAALVLAGLAVRAGRAARVLAAGAGLSLWLALGPTAGADLLARHLPIWSSFRYAEKLVGPFTLAVAVLAGLGVDRLAAGGRRLLVALGAAAALAGALALAVWAVHATALPWNAQPPELAAAARGQIAASLVRAAVAFGVTLAAWGAARRWVGSRAGRFIVAGLVLAETAAAIPYALRVGEVRPDAVARLDGASPPPPARLIHPAGIVRGDGPERLDETDRLDLLEARTARASYNVSAGLDTWDAYTGLPSRRLLELRGAMRGTLGDGRWLALRRYACNLVVVQERLDEEGARLASVAVTGGERVYAARDRAFQVWSVPHRPWAYFAPAVTSVASVDAAQRALLASIERDDVDVILEAPPPAGTSAGRVLSVRRAPERVELEAESDGPAVLVVNDAHAPGWSATIDGRPANILRADAFVRAVEWPGGRHALVMRYEAPGLSLGLVTSAVSIAIVAALAVLAVLRRRAARAHSRLHLPARSR